MTRLQELLSKSLSRGQDDEELDELELLLDTYRRSPRGPWEQCELDGRIAYRRQLDCGHVEIVDSPPQPAIIRRPDGTEQELALSAVCHTCCRTHGDA